MEATDPNLQNRIKELEDEIFFLKQKEEKLHAMLEFASELIDLPELVLIYKKITQFLVTSFPNTLILFVSIDEISETTCLEQIAGLPNSILRKALEITGFNPLGRTYSLIPSYNDKFRSGKFIEFKAGLSEFAASAFPKFIASSLEKLIGINKIYTIGIKKNENLLAAIHFITFNGQEIKDALFVEDFVRQVGVVLQKKIAEIALIKNEKILKESEFKYKLLVNHSFELIWSINSDRNLTYVSPSFNRITGYNPDDLMGKYFMEFIHFDDVDKCYKFITDTISRKTSLPWIEYRFQHKDGSWHWHSSSATPVMDNEGKLISVVGISRDISEQKKYQENLIRVNKQLNELNETKNKLFSIIAHDLRSPFNSILGYSEVLSKHISKFDPEKIEDFANSIRLSAKNTLVLLENLLSWSKTQTGKITFVPENLLLKPLMQQIIYILDSTAKIKDVKVVQILSDDLMVFADENMLVTILQNLIANAIKYSYSEGLVEIQAVKRVEVVEISVKDHGVGILDEVVDSLFKKFGITSKGTANEKGSGLGLLLCKEFVDRHGGKIWVESEIGEGSVFYVHFPLPNKS